MSVNQMCPICGSSEISAFFEILDVPVHIGILWSSRDAARNCPKGDIKLGFCKACTFIWNMAFDASRLQCTQAYDNSLYHSPFHAQYARSIALHLIERYDLHGKNVIEIGCGKADFLLYLICSRYVLEHTQNPVVFLSLIRHNIGDRANTVLYFEVPNVYLILRSLAIWNIIYEHCSYLSPRSLRHIFESCGFDILELNEVYHHQIFSIEAKTSKAKNALRLDQLGDLDEISSDVIAFVPNYQKKIQTWLSQLQNIEKTGQRAVIWGAGAKGLSFLNMLNIQDQIEYAVDINPHKNGMYVAGTGQKIVSPEFLQHYHPDIIIVMNSVYTDEIQEMIKSIGITAKTLNA
jgi:hypothetical protein